MSKIVGLQVKKPKNTGTNTNPAPKPQNGTGAAQQASGGTDDPNAGKAE